MGLSVKLRGVGGNVFRVVRKVLLHCWALASAAVLSCLLLYWTYGGYFAFLLLCFAVTGILYHTEDMLLYHPDLPPHSRVFVPVPSMFALPYENINVRAVDGTKLHLFFIRQPGEAGLRAPTIVYLHGNAGNMGHRMQNVVGLFHNLQVNVLMLEYRGYGLSEGAPSESGLCMDARAAMDFLASRQDVNHKQVVIFGRSLGGAVAVDVASHPDYAAKVWALVLENTFTGVPDMARVLIGRRLLRAVPLCFYKNKFLSLRKIGKVTAATAFVSGLSDSLVPPSMMCALHEASTARHKALLPIPGGTHNETWTAPGYYQSLADFLRKAPSKT